MSEITNIPCESCGFDPTRKVISYYRLVVPFEWGSLNEVGVNGKGRLGGKYRRYRTKFEKELAKHVANVPKAKLPRRITMTRVMGKHKHRYDDDNLLLGAKPLRDTLTKFGLILNDDPNSAEFIYKQERSSDGKPYVRILIEELDYSV